LHQVLDYVDGALDADACAELERHLAACPDCRVVINSLTNTIELYQRLPSTPLSSSAAERLYHRLNLPRS
jgi:anti-sigma factor RsiW